LLAGAEAVLNFVIGRRTPYAVAFGAQRRRNTKMAEQDVRESQKAIEQLELDLQDVAEEYKSALGQVSDKWMRALSVVSEVPLTPKKSDIFADMVALAWVVSTGANG
jgi:predicted metal-dependent hydrolase